MRKEYSRSFGFAFAMHVALIILLACSFSQTIIPAMPEDDPLKDTLEAVVINTPAQKRELAKLEKQVTEPKKTIEKTQPVEEKVNHELALKEEAAKKEKLAKEKAQKIIEEQKLLEIAEEKKQKQEKEGLAKAEKEKAEAEAKKIRLAEEKKAEEKKKALELARKQDDERLQKLADAKLKELASVQTPTATTTTQAPSPARMRSATRNLIAQHAALIQSKIHKNWRQPLGLELRAMNCKLSVKLSMTGDVIEAVVVQSSGNKEFDRSTELAVMKSSPLPMPSDPQILTEFRKFTFTFNPEDA